ncbi:MAG TPA: molybdopterin-dependent oxidoreductase [Terriglobales bacterium]|nr:molybdopterin-dependent oxidoreductase [Terriglobales bacterium]
MKKVVHAACPHDCPDACGVLITVEDGRATRIQGDPKHPVTRGFLCAKVAKYLDRVYSPDRVLYPMRRVGPKGAQPGVAVPHERFQRITWDEALDEIAARLSAIAVGFGPEAILPYSYGGTLGALNGASMDRRFFHRLGASQLARTICSEAGTVGIKSVLGLKVGTEPEQFAHSRYIIAWGANIHGNNVHLWPFIEEARRKGAKFVVIDPYKTRTAACADWYLPINPGTDVALALGLMHVIIGENLYDADYVARHTFGFDQLREKVKEYPPQRVAQWTGISAGDIVKLAREYATTRPAAIRLNYGIQRSDNGGMAVRCVTMLPCITGSWKQVGGGLQLSTGESYKLDKNHLERPDLMQVPLGRAARVVNMIEIGKALNTLAAPPIKAVVVYNSNPVAVAPDHHKVVRGFARDDLFTVVHEQFFTDTTDYADLVLPAATFFEHKDLQTGYGHYFVQISDAAIAPLGECRSNFELFAGLAQRMGFEEACFRESVDSAIDGTLASGHEWVRGIDRARLEREGHVRLNLPHPADTDYFLPFAEGGFPTASGKAELYSEAMGKLGLDPVAAFVPPAESRHVPEARRFPLELLARKADNFLNSTFSNLPSIQAMEQRQALEISHADAEARGIRDGDTVRVFNSRGEVHLKAKVNGAVRPGVVAGRLDWAKLSAGGKNLNALVADRVSDLGGGPVFYSVLVEVERRTGSSSLVNIL